MSNILLYPGHFGYDLVTPDPIIIFHFSRQSPFGGLAHVLAYFLSGCDSIDNFVSRALAVLFWSVSFTLCHWGSHSVPVGVIHGGGRHFPCSGLQDPQNGKASHLLLLCHLPGLPPAVGSRRPGNVGPGSLSASR